MGIDVLIDDICEFVVFDGYDDDSVSTNTNNNSNQQPVINIINSNVIIRHNNNNTYSDNIIYDDNNDEYEFVFEEPGGDFGAPSAGANDDDLDFGDIIEI
jgi:hypothetical protein